MAAPATTAPATTVVQRSLLDDVRVSRRLADVTGDHQEVVHKFRSNLLAEVGQDYNLRRARFAIRSAVKQAGSEGEFKSVLYHLGQCFCLRGDTEDIIQYCKSSSRYKFVEAIQTVIDCIDFELPATDERRRTNFEELLILSGDVARFKVFMKYEHNLETKSFLKTWRTIVQANQVGMIEFLHNEYRAKISNELWSHAIQLGLFFKSDKIVKYIVERKLISEKEHPTIKEFVEYEEHKSRYVEMLIAEPNADYWIPLMKEQKNYELLKRIHGLTLEMEEIFYCMEPDEMKLSAMESVEIDSKKRELQGKYNELERLFHDEYDLIQRDSEKQKLVMEFMNEETDLFAGFLTSAQQYGIIWTQNVLRESKKRWNNLVEALQKTLQLLAEKEKPSEPLVAQVDFNFIHEYERIYNTQRKLVNLLHIIARRSQGQLYADRPKGFARICEKVQQAQFQTPDATKAQKWNVRDIIRGIINYKNLSALRAGINEFGTRSEIVVVDWKMRFAKCIAEDNNVMPVGKWTEGEFKDEAGHTDPNAWQDTVMYIKFKATENDPNPLLCEVQLCLMSFTLARKKLGGHAAYSVFRGCKEIKENIFTAAHICNETCPGYEERRAQEREA